MTAIGSVLAADAGWRIRFANLIHGQPPAVKGWTNGKNTCPTWVDGPLLTRAFFTIGKGNQYRIIDEHGEPLSQPDSFVGTHRCVSLTGQGPEGSDTWWDFGDMYRYFHPWTHNNAPIQQHLYLSPGQLKCLREGDASDLFTDGFSTYWPTFKAVTK